MSAILRNLMADNGLARSRAEADRLVKEGRVFIGGCARGCTWFTTAKCTCGGWRKARDPRESVESGEVVKVGNMGSFRCLPKLNGHGFDQLRGVCRA